MTVSRFSPLAEQEKKAFDTTAPVAAARALEACLLSVRRSLIFISRWDEPSFDLNPVADAVVRAFGALLDASDGRQDGAGSISAFFSALDDASSRLSMHGIPAEPNAALLNSLLVQARSEASGATDWLAMQKNWPAPDAQHEHWLLSSGDLPRLFELSRPTLLPKPKLSPFVPPLSAPPERERIGPAASLDELKTVISALKNKAAEQKEAAQAARESKKKVLDTNTSKLEASPAKEIPPSGFARVPGKGLSSLAYVRARTREYAEEIAMVGMQRAPLLGDPFRIALGLEQRMIRAIDGIASFGGEAVRYLPEFAMDTPAPDPTRIFSVTMALGCIAGRDALAIAEHVLLAGEPDPEVISGYGNAMKLVPHNKILESLSSLLSEGDPNIRAMAVDVLGFRGLLTQEDALRAMEDTDPRVRAKALLYSAGFPEPSVAGKLLDESRAGEGPCRDAARMALVRRGDTNILTVLEDELMKSPKEMAAVLSGIVADEYFARRLVDLCRNKPCAELAAGLGWLGACDSIELLISFLESDNDALRLASAWALERITGAGLWEEAVAEEEEMLLSEPSEPDFKEPKPPALARTVSDAEDLPPEPGAEVVEQPSLNSMRWKTYWIENRGQFDERGRYRAGRPFTPSVVLDELDVARRTPAERRLLQIELAMRTGGWVRLDPHDWVVQQEGAIRLWKPIAAKASSQPGRWAYAY